MTIRELAVPCITCGAAIGEGCYTQPDLATMAKVPFPSFHAARIVDAANFAAEIGPGVAHPLTDDLILDSGEVY